jgi:hypothetical protein
MSRRWWIAAAFVCALAFVLLVCLFFNGFGVADTRIVEPGQPRWAILAFFCALSGKAMIWLAIRASPAALRRRRGLCENCGYDLRASVDRCPECGQPIR